MRGVLRGLVICVAGVSLGLWAPAVVDAQETPTHRSRRPASGWSARKGTEKSVSLDTLEEKLKRILANQQSILQKADAVKQELGVIKARTSSASRHTFLSTGAACPACACP